MLQDSQFKLGRIQNSRVVGPFLYVGGKITEMSFTVPVYGERGGKLTNYFIVVFTSFIFLF